MWAKLFVKLLTSSGSSIFICVEEPDDVNNFTKNLAHILNFASFIVHITFYSINGVTYIPVIMVGKKRCGKSLKILKKETFAKLFFLL